MTPHSLEGLDLPVCMYTLFAFLFSLVEHNCVCCGGQRKRHVLRLRSGRDWRRSPRPPAPCLLCSKSCHLHYDGQGYTLPTTLQPVTRLPSAMQTLLSKQATQWLTLQDNTRTTKPTLSMRYHYRIIISLLTMIPLPTHGCSLICVKTLRSLTERPSPVALLVVYNLLCSHST